MYLTDKLQGHLLTSKISYYVPMSVVLIFAFLFFQGNTGIAPENVLGIFLPLLNNFQLTFFVP
jgi:predicted anti-sigma-YlaC factor YlaD